MNILITVCNSSFYGAAKTLIASVHQTSYEVVDRIYIYNLGMTDYEIEDLDRMEKVEVVDFKQEFPNIPIYPTFLQWKEPTQHVYKLIMKHDMCVRFAKTGDNMLFLDAGICVVNSLQPIYDLIDVYHIFTVAHDIDDECKGMHTIRRWTHPKCMELMEVTPEEATVLQVHGGIFGFKCGGYWQNLVNEAVKWAMKPEVILGDHSNHRHDQSVLSILCARYNIEPQRQILFGEYRGLHVHPDQVLYVHRRKHNNHEGIRYAE